MVGILKRFLHQTWLLNLVMFALFCAGILFAFYEVLPANVIFLAPDAPIERLPWREALGQLFTPAPAVLNIFRLFPLGFSYEGSFWADMLICCLGIIFFLRGRKCCWGAAWIGGFAAAFAGYFATLFCAGHRGVVDAIAVTSFAFGLVHRGITTGQWRWFILLGLLLPLGLAAQADIWFIMMVGVFAYSLLLLTQECVQFGVRTVLKKLWPGMVWFLLSFCIVGRPAFQHTFGSAQATRETQLAQVTATAHSEADAREAQWTFTTDWSLPPEDWVDIVIPFARGGTSYAFDRNPYVGRMGSQHQVLRQHSIHIGWLVLMLGAIALVFRREKKDYIEPLFWAGLALVGFLLALGKYTPLYQIVWQLPFIDHIRAPVKWLHLTGIATAILAGYGAQRIIPRLGNLTAVGCCFLIMAFSAPIIQHHVFPIRLPTETQLRALPKHARIFTHPTYHAWVRSYGFTPVNDPRYANAALVLEATRDEFELKVILPKRNPNEH